MTQLIPDMMHAAAIDRFGGSLGWQRLPVPNIEADEVLIRLESVGVGVWDRWEREGAFRELLHESYGYEPVFPYVIGFEGAGSCIGGSVGRGGRSVRQASRG